MKEPENNQVELIAKMGCKMSLKPVVIAGEKRVMQKKIRGRGRAQIGLGIGT